MAQTAQVLEKPGGAYIRRNPRLPLQAARSTQPIISFNGNRIDPPHDWLDDALEAVRRPQGPYTFDNADEYLDTEPVELYNGWLVRQEMSDYEGKVFEGGLHEHVSSAARLLRFGRVLLDQMECLLKDGYTLKPDLSMVSWERQRQRVRPYGPNNRSTLMGSPEFVVEIRSPSNSRKQEKDKRARYFDNGAEIIWDIDEKNQIIYVYRTGSRDKPEIYMIDDEIDCEPLLPGWRRLVSAFFEEEASVEVVFSEIVDTFHAKGHEEGEKIGREEGEKIGREEGEKIGEQRGEQRSKQDMLVRLVQARFIDLPETTLDTIKQTDDIEQLDSWFNQTLMAQSLDELSF